MYFDVAKIKILFLIVMEAIFNISLLIQGGPKVSLHTLGLIPTSCFILKGCCFADGILYLLVRGFRRQNLKIRIS